MTNAKISALASATTPLAGTEVLPVVQSSATTQVTVANLTAGRAVATGNLSVTGTITASGLITGSVGGAFQGNTTPAAGAGVEVRYSTQGILLAYDRTGGVYKPMQYDGISHTFITSSGGTLFSITSSATTFTTNNLVQGTAAKGVNFTANTPAAGMTSQLLNWYEEGTWTPNLVIGWTTLGTATLYGKYVRIGSKVWIYGSLQYSTTLTSAGGNTRVTGMPFTQNANFTGVPVPVSLSNLGQPGVGFFGTVGVGIYFPAFTAGSASCVFEFSYFI